MHNVRQLLSGHNLASWKPSAHMSSQSQRGQTPQAGTQKASDQGRHMPSTGGCLTTADRSRAGEKHPAEIPAILPQPLSSTQGSCRRQAGQDAH